MKIKYRIYENDIIILFYFNGLYTQYCLYRMSTKKITAYNYINNETINYLHEQGLEIKNLDEINISK